MSTNPIMKEYFRQYHYFVEIAAQNELGLRKEYLCIYFIDVTIY